MQKRLIVLFGVLALLASSASAQKSATKSEKKPGGTTKVNTTAPTPVTGEPVTTKSGLKYWDIKVGDGFPAVEGKTVKVHYTGWLTNGKKFDSSVDRKEPFEFRLGGGDVIRGWDEGVAGMKIGGRRQLRIPPELGYGNSGAGGVIPPGATLIFDVELVGVR